MANGGDGFDSTAFDFTDDDVQEESFPRIGTVKKRSTDNVPARTGPAVHGNRAESLINQLNDILAGEGTNNLEEFPLDDSNVGKNEDVPPVVDVQPPAVAGDDTIRKQFRECVNHAHREHGAQLLTGDGNRD